MLATDGSCVRIAVSQLTGALVDIPDWVTGNDVITYCDRLGLICFHQGMGLVEMDTSVPAVIVYVRENGKGHAEYTHRLDIGLQAIEQHRCTLYAVILSP